MLHLTPTSFYYIGVNSIQEFKVYIDLCSLKDEKVTCESFADLRTISSTKKPIESITTYRRSNGASIAVWSYKYSGRAEWVYIERKAIGFTDHSYPLSYSTLHAADEYFMFVSKTGRYVSILYEKEPFYTGISEDMFTAEQLV